MATPAERVPNPESRPRLRLVQGLAQERQLWREMAGRIGIEELFQPDELEQTHVLIHGGEAIGAAGVYTRRVKLGEAEIHAAEVESFSTNEAYFHPGYLALVTGIIDQDPELTVIDGVTSPEMSAVASDIAACLPPGWVCEYSLIDSGIGVTTFDPEALAAHLARLGRAEHSFKRL
jgi:hypothetical protein